MSAPHITAPLIDSQGRRINYLRLAITDRCNLRCRYCRPAKGVPFMPHDQILTLEELEFLVGIFCDLGVEKVRVTGGEPFSRRGCVPFLSRIRRIAGLKFLHITTNGVKTARYLDELVAIGVSGVNLSLDTLDRARFQRITRRDFLDSVLETLRGLIDRAIPLKINSVVLEDTTDEEIVRLVSLTEKQPVTLRFIERMPFSGTTGSVVLGSGDLVCRLRGIFPTLVETPASQAPTTARLFALPGHQGRLGVIQGYSRLFCKNCNKVRITPAGILKTCLYDDGALDLKQLLRSGAGAGEIKQAIVACVSKRFINGHEAERFSARKTEPSMAAIGG
ncbi:MAG TPA: GTP 3',8-cyclase MoaA [Desulfurivibrio alkaliphilus]|uniref:GTP 3',8-cyclase n=1 Tax=Desulfurivibrio alkaliphilus TaxID=427923 RepID=A0A7C2TH39_9BACT|nr:GTP 3',8-cyclase MoaA [Desulfurivibrio alkaliphilus]